MVTFKSTISSDSNSSYGLHYIQTLLFFMHLILRTTHEVSTTHCLILQLKRQRHRELNYSPKVSI